MGYCRSTLVNFGFRNGGRRFTPTTQAIRGVTRLTFSVRVRYGYDLASYLQLARRPLLADGHDR